MLTKQSRNRSTTAEVEVQPRPPEGSADKPIKAKVLRQWLTGHFLATHYALIRVLSDLF